MMHGTLRLTVWAVAALLAPAAIPGLARAQPFCGPGSHWVDGCGPAGGSDVFPSSGAVVGIDLNLDCVKDQNLILSGPTTVQRQGASDASTNFPGAFGSSVDAHIDVIDTEIVSMSLTGSGYTLTVGQGITPGGVILNQTLGTIVEQAADSTLADSFFDVYFEVGLPGGATFLYNQSALTVSDVIDRVPPDAVYFHPVACVPLFTQQVGGVHLANLTSARHITMYTPKVPSIQQSGLAVLALALAAAAILSLARLRHGAAGGDDPGVAQARR